MESRRKGERKEECVGFGWPSTGAVRLSEREREREREGGREMKSEVRNQRTERMRQGGGG